MSRNCLESLRVIIFRLRDSGPIALARKVELICRFGGKSDS